MESALLLGGGSCHCRHSTSAQASLARARGLHGNDRLPLKVLAGTSAAGGRLRDGSEQSCRGPGLAGDTAGDRLSR